jgi:hypothetical protein
MPNLTTIAEWAKTVGISRQSAYDAVKRCEIPVTDGQVDPDYATHLYGKNTRQRANGNRPDPLASAAQPAGAAGSGGSGGTEPKTKTSVPGYDSSRARREAAEAEIAEIKLAEQAGKFLVRSDVDSCVFEVARAMRDGLMNCARRIAADVAPLMTADECETVIDREHRALLESLAHSLNEQLGVRLAEPDQ